MDKELREIIVGFENCEEIIIPGIAIGAFLIDGIHPVIRRVACNSICKYFVADEVVMEIFKEGNYKYKPFGCLDEKDSLERLSEHNDISSLTIVYKDETMDTFMVPYSEDENGYIEENLNEDKYISDLNNVYIVISTENKTVKDYFDLEEINDENSINHAKDMMDIGIEEEKVVELSKDSLPELYEYVYIQDKDGNNALAVRVEDDDSGWKWVYEDIEKKGMIPVNWKYPNTKIREFIKNKNIEGKFSLDTLKDKYSTINNNVFPTSKVEN
ncbi:hypothetical protein [Hungatella hathewayi]|uniref:hypothetical protein n=1 Tax=Hungatella hathewayi TaxID=154046 RepID=UPI003569D52F